MTHPEPAYANKHYAYKKKHVFKPPISTLKPPLLGQIREFRIELNIQERKLLYLHRAITSISRTNDIPHIQIKQQSDNKESIINQNIKLLEKYNINEAKERTILIQKIKLENVSENKNRRKSTKNL